MPLTEFQQSILRLLAQNRSPESYLAGAAVLHQLPDSPRFSEDLDLFHDAEDSVAQCAEFDAEVLRRQGLGVQWTLRQPTFFRAVVAGAEHALRLEWGQESAFRFFPVEQDALCGFRLHLADAATNKVLALAGRSEARDFVDVLHLHRTHLSLGALSWAACGKDQGFTPDFLLDQMNRHTALTQGDLDRLALASPLSLPELKRQWLAALAQAEQLVAALPAAELGCFYLDGQGIPVEPDPSQRGFVSLQRHFGRLRGAWPVISG